MFACIDRKNDRRARIGATRVILLASAASVALDGSVLTEASTRTRRGHTIARQPLRATRLRSPPRAHLRVAGMWRANGAAPISAEGTGDERCINKPKLTQACNADTSCRRVSNPAVPGARASPAPHRPPPTPPPLRRKSLDSRDNWQYSSVSRGVRAAALFASCSARSRGNGPAGGQALVAQLAEHILGKNEVSGSSPDKGSNGLRGLRLHQGASSSV
jgi:hypothetical protein